MMGSPKPIPSSFFRSPAPVPFQAPPAPIPAPATLPLAAVSPPRPAITRSTTPPGSPPAVNFQSIFQRLAAPQAQEPKQRVVERQKKESVVVISDDEEEEEIDEEDEDDYGEDEEEEEQSIRPVTKSSTSAAGRDRIERAESKAIAQRAREIEEEETEREREQALQKRLPSLPEPQLLTKDDDEDEDEEDEEMSDREEEPKKSSARTIVKKATKEDLRTRTSPSKIVMPGTFGAALVAASSNQNSPRESEVEDNEEDGDDENEDDRTTMSMMSTTTSTYNAGGAFRVSCFRVYHFPDSRADSEFVSALAYETQQTQQAELYLESRFFRLFYHRSRPQPIDRKRSNEEGQCSCQSQERSERCCCRKEGSFFSQASAAFSC